MKKKIIVIGGGFAGLQFIRNLKKNMFDVLLIDRLNHHQFQPLFYQVATSQIEPASISFPLRKIFQDRMDVTVRMAEVLAVDPPKKTITTTAGRLMRICSISWLWGPVLPVLSYPEHLQKL